MRTNKAIATSITGLLGGLLAAGSFAPAAMATEGSVAAAKKKPKNSISAPATAVVGEPITVKTVFNAQNRKGHCFEPDLTFGDEVIGGADFYIGVCMNNRGGKKFSVERDSTTHTYTRPGTYTITAIPGYLKGSGAASGELDTSGLNKFIRGPKKVSTTITVTSPDQEELTPEQKAAVLTPGAVYSSREDIANLVNALGWSNVWIGDLYSPDAAGDVTYDVANGQQFVTRRVTGADGSVRGRVFVSPENTSVRVYNPGYSDAGMFPDGGHIVFDSRAWTSNDGSPIPGMYVWSTNPTKGVARPIG